VAIAFEKLGDMTVAVVLMEELDASNSAEFKHEIAPLLAKTRRVIFDLSRLRFVDSSGLGVFISCLRQMRARDGEMTLCGMSNPVRAAFELARLHQAFDIRGTAAEAVICLMRSPLRNLPIGDSVVRPEVVGRRRRPATSGSRPAAAPSRASESAPSNERFRV
jgi:anti-sigma B factor antagonist